MGVIYELLSTDSMELTEIKTGFEVAKCVPLVCVADGDNLFDLISVQDKRFTTINAFFPPPSSFIYYYCSGCPDNVRRFITVCIREDLCVLHSEL